jgi:hypothetical protein
VFLAEQSPLATGNSMTPIRPNADTPTRFCPRRQLTLATVLSLAFMLLVLGAGAAETEFASQPTTFLELEVAVRAHPRKAVATVTEFLQSGPSVLFRLLD